MIPARAALINLSMRWRKNFSSGERCKKRQGGIFMEKPIREVTEAINYQLAWDEKKEVVTVEGIIKGGGSLNV
jgi:hypothetical protein